MKAVLPLVLTALLGLGSGGGAVAQIAPGDPAGNQTSIAMGRKERQRDVRVGHRLSSLRETAE